MRRLPSGGTRTIISFGCCSDGGEGFDEEDSDDCGGEDEEVSLVVEDAFSVSFALLLSLVSNASLSCSMLFSSFLIVVVLAVMISFWV